MIKIGNDTWRTLDQPLYINGKIVKEVYANGIKVYPEESYGRDVYIIKIRGHVRHKIPCEIEYGKYSLDDRFDYWGGENYQTIYDSLHDDERPRYLTGGVAYLGKKKRYYYTSELSYVAVLRCSDLQYVKKDNKEVYRYVNNPYGYLSTSQIKTGGYMDINFGVNGPKNWTLERARNEAAGVFFSDPLAYIERNYSRCVIKAGLAHMVAYKAESKNISMPVLGPSVHFGVYEGHKVAYCYVVEPTKDYLDFNNFMIEKKKDRDEWYSNEILDGFDMSIRQPSSPSDSPSFPAKCDIFYHGYRGDIGGVRLTINLGRAKWNTAPCVVIDAHSKNPQRIPSYLKPELPMYLSAIYNNISIAPIEEILYMGKENDTAESVYDLSKDKLFW